MGGAHEDGSASVILEFDNLDGWGVVRHRQRDLPENLPIVPGGGLQDALPVD